MLYMVEMKYKNIKKLADYFGRIITSNNPEFSEMVIGTFRLYMDNKILKGDISLSPKSRSMLFQTSKSHGISTYKSIQVYDTIQFCEFKKLFITLEKNK